MLHSGRKGAVWYSKTCWPTRRQCFGEKQACDPAECLLLLLSPLCDIVSCNTPSMWSLKKKLWKGQFFKLVGTAHRRATPGPGVVTVESRNMSASSAKSSKKDNSNHGGGDESSGKPREQRFNPSIAMFTGRDQAKLGVGGSLFGKDGVWWCCLITEEQRAPTHLLAAPGIRASVPVSVLLLPRSGPSGGGMRRCFARHLAPGAS